MLTKKLRKAKALVLFSGGLDSILAIKLLQMTGKTAKGRPAISVEAINFITPFSAGQDYVDRIARKFRVKVHKVKVGSGYFSMVRKPMHGYGANMNPCLDCKIWMLRRAAAFAKKRRFDFLATGEVVGERPFSQQKAMLFLIEKEAGLGGKVVRPLSGKLLPVTEAERKGLVKRESLLSISGRNRSPQLRLAKQFGIKEFPTPGGGCLLTDPGFSRKLRDFLRHSKTLSWDDVLLLRLGRHFRLGPGKIIVGRNHPENLALKRMARKKRLPWMEVQGFMGPVTLVHGKSSQLVEKAAALTFRYSDAPKNVPTMVVLGLGKKKTTIEAGILSETEVDNLRI